MEKRIQAHILNGNLAFFQHRYTQALDEYLTAWGLLPTFVYPFFPAIAAKVNDTQLLGLDILSHLTQASTQVHRLRDLAGPKVPIVPPVDPPDPLLRISEKYGIKGDDARKYYQIGTAYVKMGEADLAWRFISRALETGVQDRELQANCRTLLGAIELARGNYEGACGRLRDASGIYQEIKKADGMAAMQHNLGVALTLAGDVQNATNYFINAAVKAPANLDWQVTQTINPGIASVMRPMGQAGLPLLLNDGDGNWFEMPSAMVGQPKRSLNVLYNGATIQIDLQAQGTVAIETQLLQPRINATTLTALDTYLWDLSQFVTYLAHVQGFVLPLALGDTYFALGDYEKAGTYYIAVRDYKYLNLSIERPMVWRKLAQCYLELGNHLFRDGDPAGANALYERIVRVVNDAYDLIGPLYSGGFAPLKDETLAFLNAADKLAYNAMDYARRIIILEALTNLDYISKGINYILGSPEDAMPIHSWRYLQNAARYFANQAIQAERAYISFKDSSEKEAFTRQALSQAVDAQDAALKVEEKRKDAAREQKNAAQESVNLILTRIYNAIAQRDDYTKTSGQLATYDRIIAFTNASNREVNIKNWATMLGIELPKIDNGWGGKMTLNVMQAPDLMELLTRMRSNVNIQYELRNMNRTIDELGSQISVANKQVDVAQKMVEVAEEQRKLAELRRDQAIAQRDFFSSKTFTPELLDNLAQAQRQISRRYLDWAIGAALLMERAFEFEYDTTINRIRLDYEYSELQGLLAGDFLLADIDKFSYDRLLETEKQVPVKITIDLADRYPYQFYQQFQKNGKIDFETFLEDFDRFYPGTHLRKLRGVEVVVEGLIGPQGVHGTLTHAGISYDRDRDGKRYMRLQKPETMILSRYDMRHDGFVFTTQEDMLAIFENRGVAGGWILDFPPESNDIDYQAITNLHLVLYFDAYYSEHVANVVRAEMAATAIYEYTVGLGLRFQYPDEFFNFQDTGAVTFAIDNTYLPRDHADPRIRQVYLAVETEKGISPAGLVMNVTIKDSGISINQATDANGMISTDTVTVPLNALRGKPLMDTWTVRIDKAANTAPFAAGFTWENVNNIFLFVEYAYTPRGHQVYRDNFSINSLTAYDVINDPLAVINAPSNWMYDAINHQIEQTSNIYGPAGAANLNAGPEKPGTYLVHKTSAHPWPALLNFILRCHLNSSEAGGNGGGGIGVVFRYYDADNFYFFLMDSKRKYRRIGKKIGGVFQELETPAVDATKGYDLDKDYELIVSAVGEVIKVYLNGVEILSGQDRSLLQPGRAGFYTWHSVARFLDYAIESL